MTASTILILIATERVSGPLKGIFQYLRHLDRARYRPVLGFIRARRGEPSDAEREAAAQRVPFAVLEQSGAFDWGLVTSVVQLAKEHRAALVQTHAYKTHLLGFLLKREFGLPWIGFAHGWTAETWRVRLYHRLDWLLRYADHTVVVSETLRRQLVSLGVSEPRIVSIHNAVDLDEGWSRCPSGNFRQTHGIPPGVPLIAVVGRISREKGHRVFLDAFSELIAWCPEVHASIIGEGVDAANIRRYAANLGIDARVHFIEWQRSVASVYVDADIIAIPSLSEGVSNVLLEAMAAGCPVVATAVGGTAEIVTDEQHALLVPASDASAMAKAMVRLLQDKALRERLADLARRHVEAEHSPVRRADRIAGLYGSLLGH